MARAKRTDRAEARRRYRATLAESSAEPDSEDSVEVEAAPSPRRRPASTPPQAQVSPTARVGIVEAFRRAAGPADIRADLAALPWLVRNTKAVWLPAVVVAVTTALMALPQTASNQWVVFAGTALIYPPPMATSFLAGILAPRASWLAGAISGLMAAIGFAVLVISGRLPVAPEAGAREALVAYAALSSVTFGGAVGAFAGFYRRFLALSNPNRGRRAQGRPQRGRPAPRRR